MSGLLVVDEAYSQFAPWSALELVADDVPLVVTRTYSKTWSMAAARLGYLIGPSWLVAELDKVVLPYHLDALKQAAGLIALDYVDDMERRVSILTEERGRIDAALRELPCEVWPSAANFILFRPTEADADAVWQALVDRSVLVRNCSGWPGLSGCLRVTVGTVVGLVAAGRTREEILREYPYLEPEDIAEALSYAAWRAEESRAHAPTVHGRRPGRVVHRCQSGGCRACPGSRRRPCARVRRSR